MSAFAGPMAAVTTPASDDAAALEKAKISDQNDAAINHQLFKRRQSVYSPLIHAKNCPLLLFSAGLLD